MITMLVTYSIFAMVMLLIILAIALTPGFAFRFSRTLDHWLPAFFVVISGLLMIAGGVLNERNLQYAIYGTVFIESEKSIVYFWMSRIVSLLIVGLSLPYLTAKAMIAIRDANKIHFAVLIFLLFALTNYLLPGILGTRPDIDHRLLYPVLVVMVVLVSSKDGVNVTLQALKWMLLLFLVLSLTFIIVDQNRVMSPGYSGFLPYFNSRFWGLANHANAIGPIAALAFMLEFYIPSRTTIVKWLVIVVSLVVLIMSQSKTAILTVIVGLAVIAYIRLSSTRNKDLEAIGFRFHLGHLFAFAAFTATVLAILLASMSGVLNLSLSDYTNTAEGYGLRTFTGRDVIWDISIQEWLRNPIFGYGTTLWDNDYRRQVGLNYAYHAHSQYFQTLAEAGLVGIFGLVLFLVATLIYSLRLATMTSGATLAICLMLLLRSVTEVPLRPTGVGTGEMMFMIAIACIWLQATLNRERLTVQ